MLWLRLLLSRNSAKGSQGRRSWRGRRRRKITHHTIIIILTTRATATATATTTGKVRYVLPPPPTASDLLFANASEPKLYWDRSHYDSPDSQISALKRSSTLYIGNLAFSTRVRHLRAAFSAVGPVEEVNMGLDRYRKTPCGFAFVKYRRRADALRSISLLTGTKLDGNVIRVELDAGFKPGRQYGRGTSGGQVRDDRRRTVDPSRRRSGEGVGAGGGAGGAGGGGIASRWQSPQQAGDGGSDGHYGSTSGQKRSRDDDEAEEEEDAERSSKNPRFDGE
mmetsp:Transcript_20913/g.46670  ORF Transcript_20913/g.46670 Transcript_20913/m.46670 type:complete len:279 (-) Transcript_20913:47-883(-)